LLAVVVAVMAFMVQVAAELEVLSTTKIIQ
jgi:hypothetical protein